MTKANPFTDKSRTIRFRLVQRSVREADGAGDAPGDGQEVPDFEPVDDVSARKMASLKLTDSAARPRPPAAAPLGLLDDALESPFDAARARMQEHAGEAAKYGIYFDDREYDYTQHLRTVGAVPGAIVIPAAPGAKGSQAGQKEALDSFFIKEEAPSSADEADGPVWGREEGPGYVTHDVIGDLELDPDIRQVLEALDDDAYVDEDFEDDFVVKLDRKNETAVLCSADLMNSFSSFNGARSAPMRGRAAKGGKAYLPSASSAPACGASDDEESALSSSDDDTCTSVRSSYTTRSYAPTMAMTSIDSKFENIIREYDDDDEDDEGRVAPPSTTVNFDSDLSNDDDDDASFRRDKTTDEQVMAEALDEFIASQNSYIRPSVQERQMGGIAFLDEMRTLMGKLSEEYLDRERSDSDHLPEDAFLDFVDRTDRVDCLSILSTYTNTENLPAIIREEKKARRALAAAGRGPFGSGDVPAGKAPSTIRLCPRTGMPILAGGDDAAPPGAARGRRRGEGEEGSGATGDAQEGGSATVSENRGAARSKTETAAEKKARKSAIKDERRESRAVKKEMRVSFREDVKAK